MEVILSYDPHFPETVRRRRDAVLGVAVHYEENIYESYESYESGC